MFKETSLFLAPSLFPTLSRGAPHGNRHSETGTSPSRTHFEACIRPNFAKEIWVSHEWSRMYVYRHPKEMLFQPLGFSSCISASLFWIWRGRRR